MNEPNEELLTRQQQKALHKWFEMLAEELRNEGVDLKDAMPKVLDILPTKENVKEMIWRPVQMALYGKNSTTGLLKKKEIDDILMVISKNLGDRGITTPPFPSAEEVSLLKLEP